MSYANFAELAAARVLGVDYRIRITCRDTGLAVVAIHGGGIETGTTELARGIAAEQWSLYLFEGLMASGNSVLHVESTDFDEPWCRWLCARSMRVVTVHGTSGTEQATYVGGLDTLVRDRVIANLTAAGFAASVSSGDIAGTEPGSVTNAGMAGAGVQLELTTAQRAAFWGTNSSAHRWNTRNGLFGAYVAAVRSALAVDVALG